MLLIQHIDLECVIYLVARINTVSSALIYKSQILSGIAGALCVGEFKEPHNRRHHIEVSLAHAFWATIKIETTHTHMAEAHVKKFLVCE